MKQFSAKWGHKSRTGVVPSLAPARCDMKYYSTPFCCTEERDEGGVIFDAFATLTVKIEFALALTERDGNFAAALLQFITLERRPRVLFCGTNILFRCEDDGSLELFCQETKTHTVVIYYCSCN